VSQPFFDLSAIIEIWSAIYQATKRAHAYGAGARECAELARDDARGALRQGAEAGRGGHDVSAPRGSARTGAGARAGANGRAGAGEAGWGSIGWLLASVGPVGGWFRWTYGF
jgi:hypothetical protein